METVKSGVELVKACVALGMLVIAKKIAYAGLDLAKKPRIILWEN